LNFIITFEKVHIENFMNICSAAAEMFHVDEYYVASSRSSSICESA